MRYGQRPARIYDYGSANMFFFEDNTFYGADKYMIISSEMGARFCIRHNDFDGTGMTRDAIRHLMHTAISQAHIVPRWAWRYTKTR